MGRVLDTLEAKLLKIKSNPRLILNEDFIMGIFQEYLDELPEFRHYWDATFNERQMAVIHESLGPRLCIMPGCVECCLVHEGRQSVIQDSV